MNTDPGKDFPFQRALKEILMGVKYKTPQEKIEALSAAASITKGLGEEGVQKLTDLRREFFWSHCFHENYSLEVREELRKTYAAFRDTPEAQAFFAKNPYYTIGVDTVLIQAANSIKKGWVQTPA